MIAVDSKPSALAAARELGAVDVVNSDGLTPDQVAARITAINGGRGVDAAIDAVAAGGSSIAALTSLAKGGRLVVAGLTSQEDKGRLDFPVDELVLKEWSIVGTLGNPHCDYPDLLGLVGSGKLVPSALIEEEVSLEDVQTVFDEMPTFQTNGFVLITKFD